MSSKVQLFQEILSSVDLFAAAMMRRMNPGYDEISQRQAWKEFGRHRIEEMVNDGMVRPTRAGTAKNSKVMYSRFEIMAAIETNRQMIDEIMTKMARKN
jgi:hypothetical protein